MKTASINYSRSHGIVWPLSPLTGTVPTNTTNSYHPLTGSRCLLMCLSCLSVPPPLHLNNFTPVSGHRPPVLFSLLCGPAGVVTWCYWETVIGWELVVWCDWQIVIGWELVTCCDWSLTVQSTRPHFSFSEWFTIYQKLNSNTDLNSLKFFEIEIIKSITNSTVRTTI